ncbi:MAG: hypothetical protein ACREVZ_13275 [Burkholderiales bacterium]
MQDDAGVSGSALSGLWQDFESGIGQPGVSASGRIEDEEAVRVQFGRNVPQGGGFADPCRSGHQTDAGLFEEPSTVLFQSG